MAWRALYCKFRNSSQVAKKSRSFAVLRMTCHSERSAAERGPVPTGSREICFWLRPTAALCCTLNAARANCLGATCFARKHKKRGQQRAAGREEDSAGGPHDFGIPFRGLLVAALADPNVVWDGPLGPADNGHLPLAVA